MTPEQATIEGYVQCRTLPTGEVGALQLNLFTVGVVVVGEYGPLKRWCYEHALEALQALAEWDGLGDPPGPWVKQKLPVERMNPNWSNHADD